MPRPEKWIPQKDILGLQTLIEEGWTQEQIAEYYSKRLPYKVAQRTISKKLEELKQEKKD
jgi:hypothetical protein